MKTFLTSIALSLSLGASATIFTVSANPSIPAQFSDIQAAHNVAEAGDTLQLVGSGNSYNLILSKRLHIIGPGWGTPPGLPAYMYTTFFNAGSEGSIMEGVQISSYASVNAPNITIKDSYIYQLNLSALATNLLVRNCVGIRQIYELGQAGGQVFANCLFNYTDGSDSSQPFAAIDGYNSTMAFPSLFTNCTFYKIYFAEMNNAQFSNCVIHSIPEIYPANGSDSDNCNGCSFNNSMLFCSGCAFTDIDGNVTLTDNLSNGNNPFINAPQTPNAYTSNTIPFNQLNFSLVASSPGINAGSDGTTIGIQGGAYPFAEGSQYGSLSGQVPYVSSFIINNPVILQGGTLDIQATGVIPANQ
jgi:hypothetical protein